MSSKVKDFYTANNHYDWITDVKFPESLLHNRRASTIQQKLQAYSVRDVLDVGCGTGFITRILPGKVTGLDIDSWKLERAKQHCPTTKFVLGDAEELLYNEEFDTVVCTDTLEHLEKPNLVIQGIYRALKSKGIFVGLVPSNSVVWKFRRFLSHSDASKEPFHHNYTAKQLQQLLTDFEILEISRQCLGLELFFAARKV